MRFQVRKQSQLPLYLQLREQITYAISTGRLQPGQALPSVRNLARSLGISTNTVQRAYAELESQGLITKRRGCGTYVSPDLYQPTSRRELDDQLRNILQEALDRAAALGFSADDCLHTMQQLTLAMPDEAAESEKHLLFVECNSTETHAFSADLTKDLQVPVCPLLLQDLRSNPLSTSSHLVGIITTFFHFKEVQDLVKDLGIQVFGVVTDSTPQTLVALSEYNRPDASVAVICRDEESVDTMHILVADVCQQARLIRSCWLGQQARVQELLGSVDMVAVTPAIYEKVCRLAPSNVRTINLIDRVNPRSVAMLRHTLTPIMNV